MIALSEGYALDQVNRPYMLRIWEPADKHGLYCIGADPAGGVGEEVGDAATAIVIDVRNLRQVAQFRTFDVNPFEFGRELNRLGRYYGGISGLAHLVVEANNHGQCTLEVLKNECGYWNLWAQNSFVRNQTRAGQSRYVTQVGYWMTPKSRDALVHDARKVWDLVSSEDYVKTFGSPIRDEYLRRELEAFRAERTKANRQVFQAAEGKHDDLVIALALAWYGRTAASYSAPLVPVPAESYPSQEFHERENRRIQQLMAERGQDWAPDDEEEKFLKVQVAWKPPS